MKRVVLLAAAMMLLAAPGAFAEHGQHEYAASEHKLLVTDVPDPGQVEARLDYVYSYAEGKNELNETIKDEKSMGVLTLGAGVVKGLKLSASLPYTFVQHQEGTAIEGLGDLTLGARYSLTKGLVHLPVDLAVGLDWQLNSASARPGKPGMGVNIYSPYLAVSKKLGEVIPYLKYQPDFVVKNEQDQINHNLIVGAEVEVCHRFSFDASIKTTVNDDKVGQKSSTDVELELVPYINIAKNTYLLPRFAYKFAGDIEDAAGVKLQKDVDEFKTGIGIYFLF